MAGEITRTFKGDAPLSAAKNPDVAGAGLPESEGEVLVGRCVTINRARAELYAFWRDFNNLPRFMENVESVRDHGNGRSHWVIAAPAGRRVEWESQIVEENEGSLISWASVEGSDIAHSGRIEFRDSSAGRGTIVTATIAYDAPAGEIGRMIAKLFQKEPKIQARRDLRRFKQLMEAGEVSTSKPPHAAPRAD